MANGMKFLPARKADVLTYATQVHDALTTQGFNPTSVGLTAGDVTELGTLLTADKASFDAANAAKLDKQAKTQAMNAPGATHAQLVAKLRNMANAARVSNASDDAIAAIGISRRDPSPTPKTAPQVPPEFSVDSVVPGIINVRFRASGSAQPRAREANAIGVQIAVVNGAAAPAAGEPDSAPNQFVSRSPASLNSTTMPDQVRLYARWITQRGHTGPWSIPLSVSVL
ncbi:MAG TPA: hypothetical protein VJT54_05905 [Verrucomicrobiae bacterium]|nr:hypothetical protein [Verrucomicrobiae bacterium]